MSSRDDSGSGYPTLLLYGPDEAIEAAMAQVFEAGCLGIETIGETTRAYFPPGTDLRALRTLLTPVAGLRLGTIEVIPDRDWVALSRAELSGGALGERFFVCPSWVSPPHTTSTGRILLRIDPEQAFGTGRHDTTRLCLELLEQRAQPNRAVIDAGTGTGILAMAAAALGCRPVVAIESDPIAAACARRNAKRNRLEHVEVVRADIGSAAPPPARLLVANLTRPLLERALPRLSRWLEPGGDMILSGILTEDLDEMASILESDTHSMRVMRYHTAGEWAALLAQSPAS